MKPFLLGCPHPKPIWPASAWQLAAQGASSSDPELPTRPEPLFNRDTQADPPVRVAKQLAFGCLEIIMELRPYSGSKRLILRWDVLERPRTIKPFS